MATLHIETVDDEAIDAIDAAVSAALGAGVTVEPQVHDGAASRTYRLATADVEEAVYRILRAVRGGDRPGAPLSVRLQP
jgi:hypothetical protein